MTNNYVCRTPYLSRHTSFDCVFCCWNLKWWHLQMLSSFLFSGLLGVGKGQKMAQNDKNNLSHSVSQELYLMWRFWFLVHMCKMMISPAIFYNFFTIVIFWVFQSSSINAKRKFWDVPTFSTCAWFFSISTVIKTHIKIL